MKRRGWAGSCGLVATALISLGLVGVPSQAATTAPSRATTAMPTSSRIVELEGPACRTVDGPAPADEFQDWSTTRCGPAVDGWTVQVEYGDVRETVTLVRGGKTFELSLWTVVSTAFSSVGSRMEFRMRAGRAVGTVVRFSHSVDDQNRQVSKLVVVRLSPTPCVVQVVMPGPRQNELARAAADRSSGRGCLE